MDAQYLIKAFEESQQMIRENPLLSKQMRKCQATSVLYLEDYKSPIRRKKSGGRVEVVETTSFQCARDAMQTASKIAVLNFANPQEPGGGVKRGAMAQEECLCRVSDLYNALAQPYFLKHYYRYHYEKGDLFFSDRLIYSPNVTVFKSDDFFPMPLEEPFSVDVITCAAPFLNGSVYASEKKLLDIYTSRIRNILEVAMAREVDVLILGAFGCGAFRNDPGLMAKAFADLLTGEQYVRYFKRVIFAIKKSEKDCKNLTAFREAFFAEPAPQYTITFLKSAKGMIPCYRDDTTAKWVELPKSFGGIYHDPVEDTPLYKKACAIVDEIQKKERGDQPYLFGSCHGRWASKKKMLKEQFGIDWHTPSELNPGCMFD